MSLGNRKTDGEDSPNAMSRPRVSINLALSADGKISSPAGIPSGWTSERDFARLKELRLRADALLVGRGTLETDNMTLRSPQNPLRCVVSRQGRFDPGHPIFSSDGGAIHLLGTERQPDPIEGTHAHHATLPDFIALLGRELKIERIHCEGGGQLIRALAEADLIDDIHLTWAGHRLFGGREAPGMTGPPGSFLPTSRAFKLVEFDPREDLGECFLSYRRKLP